MSEVQKTNVEEGAKVTLESNNTIVPPKIQKEIGCTNMSCKYLLELKTKNVSGIQVLKSNNELFLVYEGSIFQENISSIMKILREYESLEKIIIDLEKCDYVCINALELWQSYCRYNVIEFKNIQENIIPFFRTFGIPFNNAE